MKIRISASSAKEFAQKKIDLIKRLSGDTHDVVEKGGKIPTAPKKNFYLAHTQMQDHWDKKFKEMLGDIKTEIIEALK